MSHSPNQPEGASPHSGGAPSGDRSSPIALLLEQHYAELRAMAERQLAAERNRDGRHAMSPSSLLGEAFARLLTQRTAIANSQHLSAIATMLFVRILADTRRRRLAQKRGGRNHAGSLDGQDVADTKPTPDQDALLDADVEFLHEKLAELAEREPRQAEALCLHQIGGLTVPQVAEMLGVSVSTVERDIALARTWLAMRLK
jgi:RNA polymerase sigma factor (TIGR02999 family)